jgi:poly-gamma-glutamate synthesis protein (capsule biosynthesis protein)
VDARQFSEPQQRARRRFLAQVGGTIACGLSAGIGAAATASGTEANPRHSPERKSASGRGVRIFLCGDVMTGRGIDQILQHPSQPRLFEQSVTSARTYVEIAEQVSGAIPRGVGPGYVWGDALVELERARPDIRIVNLETAVTAADSAWRGKGINYRMHPANASCLAAAKIDCCVLANNHVLDWGYEGLRETAATLHALEIRTAGAGDNSVAAATPASISTASGRRVLVFAYCSPSAGVPQAWAARDDRPGVNLLDESAPDAVERVARDVNAARRPGDLVIASLHWGGNWGYAVAPEQRAVARRLIDEAGVDLVHGHSSHHPQPFEVYRNKLILYGCGDFLNDYEGIGGHEAFRPELSLMYLPELDPATGRLQGLTLVPTRVQKFRVTRATAEDATWLEEMLNREGRALGTGVRRRADGTLTL